MEWGKGKVNFFDSPLDLVLVQEHAGDRSLMPSPINAFRSNDSRF